MDVEVGTKKRWLIFFAAIGIVIAGLVIAIVVVKNLSKKIEDNNVVMGPYDIYEDINYEINKKLTENENMSGEQVLDLYKSYIDKEENPEVKAYLLRDYYMEIQAQDSSMNKSKEVLDGLIEVDKTLNTAASAMIVWSTAEYYKEEQTAIKYKEISEVRMSNGVELEYTE